MKPKDIVMVTEGADKGEYARITAALEDIGEYMITILANQKCIFVTEGQIKPCELPRSKEYDEQQEAPKTSQKPNKSLSDTSIEGIRYLHRGNTLKDYEKILQMKVNGQWTDVEEVWEDE